MLLKRGVVVITRFIKSTSKKEKEEIRRHGYHLQTCYA